MSMFVLPFRNDAANISESPAADETVSASHYTDSSVGYIMFSIFVNGTTLLVCLLIFEVLMRTSSHFLAPRLREIEYGRFPFGWAWHAFKMSEKEYMERMSLDGVVMVRFCELGFKFCAWGSISSAIMMPVYAFGSAGASGLNVFTLSNVLVGTDRFWCAVVSAYVLIALFAKLVIVEWKTFVQLRRQHLCKKASGVHGINGAQTMRSLRIECMTGRQCSETELQFFFERLFGKDSVFSVVVQRDTSALHKILGVHNCARLVSRCLCFCCYALEDRSRSLGPDTFVATTPVIGTFNHTPVLLSTRSHCSREYVVRAQKITSMCTAEKKATFNRAQNLCGERTCTAFVTLKKVADRVVAEQIYLTHEHSEKWSIYEAPDQRDILWYNAANEEPNITFRSKVVAVLRVFGLLFWSIPMSAIQAWASIDSLVKWVPFFEDLQTQNPVMSALIGSYLPVLALMLVLLILPYSFQFLATRFEGVKTKSEVAHSVLTRNFLYQLTTLYVLVLSGSIWGSLEKILENPHTAWSLLRGTIPTVSNYFIHFVFARAGVTLSLYLLRPWDYFWCTKDPQAQIPPVYCTFGMEAVYLCLVFTLGLTYTFIAPAMLPACALYFAIALLVYKWLFTYVYYQEYDTGGAFWYDLFAGVMGGLFLGTLTLVAMAAAYENYWSGPFLSCVPLPIMVAALYRHCTYHYMIPSYHLSLEDAIQVDSSHPDLHKNFDHGEYQDPILELTVPGFLDSVMSEDLSRDLSLTGEALDVGEADQKFSDGLQLASNGNKRVASW